MQKRQLISLAGKLKRAEREYKKAFDTYVDGLKPLDDTTFWRLQRAFVKHVLEFYFGYGRKDVGVSQAFQEMWRLVAVKDHPGCSKGDPGWTRQDLRRFSQTWLKWSTDLHNKLEDVPMDKSDDAFSDFTDALPMAGQGVCRKIMNGELATASQIKFAIDECVNKQMADFIWNGENYIFMALDDTARECTKAWEG